MGFPDTYVSMIQTMYIDVASAVHHQNRLTPTFDLGRGVCQGCPHSCHLFNLVGQVLIYYLQDNGFFLWWSFSGDPCSLYVDNTALFLFYKKELSPILSAITEVGTFTGLTLNIDKTIAFSPVQTTPTTCGRVVIAAKPVKYLGTVLGLGQFISCEL